MFPRTWRLAFVYTQGQVPERATNAVRRLVSDAQVEASEKSFAANHGLNFVIDAGKRL